MKNSNVTNPKCVTIDGVEYIKKKLLSKSEHVKIYKGLNPQNNKFVIIKILNYTEINEIQKYKLLAQKKCKNVMNIINIEQTAQKINVALEFSEKSLMKESNEQIKGNQRYIIKSIANGLNELHTLGISHLQLSLRNIVIETLEDKYNNYTQNIYKICDYGHLLVETDLEDFYAGTTYQAPEQIHTNSILLQENKVDIWAFGIICLQLFNASEAQINRLISGSNNQEEINESISSLNFNPNFKEAFIKMLQIDPEKRENIKKVLLSSQRESQIIKKQQTRIKSITVPQPQAKFNQSEIDFRVQSISVSGIKEQSRQNLDNKKIQNFCNFNYGFSQAQLKKLNNG